MFNDLETLLRYKIVPIPYQRFIRQALEHAVHHKS